MIKPRNEENAVFDYASSIFDFLNHEENAATKLDFPIHPFRDQGANQIYTNHQRPFLLRHQAKLDHIVVFVYCELAKVATTHEVEFQFVKKV
ncbi:hypothetical protein RND81_06G179600 [Saponaria officinalis]|uniref:Uncharacterized protein n=1 Tax=Saponaria officinalis TaxID=3572 RepID=A0AAW1K837_SAPOF